MSAPSRPSSKASVFPGLILGGFVGLILITIVPSLAPVSYRLVGWLVCDGELEVGATSDRGVPTRGFSVSWSGQARCHDGERTENVTQAATAWLCPLHVLAGALLGGAGSALRSRRQRARSAGPRDAP